MCFFPISTQASNRGISAGGSPGARRVALVIGNADYDKGRLKNPVNDARALEGALRGLGFEVVKGENLTQKQMKRAIDDFGRKLRRAEVGLFFYAGHGVQVDGRNYLIPIGARLSDKPDVEYEAVRAGRVLAKMQSADTKLNLVVLDACRDNPFARSFRSQVGQGLAYMDAPGGSIIAYATAPGQVAADGGGSNSPFTSALVRHLDRPGVSVDRVLKLTGAEVSRATGGKQQPWISTNFYGDYFLAGKQIEGVGAPQQPPLQLADSPGPALGQVDKRKLKIQRLLKQADADLAANRLTTPPGNNALEKYQEVLQLNPMTEAANEGLKRIVGKYTVLAEGRIRAEDYGKAEQYLSRAEKVSEGDNRVLAARDELLKARDRAKKTEEAAQKKADKQARTEAARKEGERKESERRRKESARAVERSSDGRFSKDASGVITDSRTGLEWFVGPNEDIDWYDAKKWVESLGVDGGGWRIPKRFELQMLYQAGQGSGNIDEIFQAPDWEVWAEGPGISGAKFFDFSRNNGGYWRVERAKNHSYLMRAFAVR